MQILYFVLGCAVGGIIEMLVQTPFEELVTKRFQQILHVGMYRKSYFQMVSYAVLEKKMKESLKHHDFDYARLLLKQMEWFVEEKTEEEKKSARAEARRDYNKDLRNIARFKGTDSPKVYNEKENTWTNGQGKTKQDRKRIDRKDREDRKFGRHNKIPGTTKSGRKSNKAQRQLLKAKWKKLGIEVKTV